MKRLWVKLVGTIALIMVLGSGAIYISVQIFTKNQYRSMIRTTDIVMAERLSDYLSAYYSRRGSWEGVEEVFGELFPMQNESMMMRRGRMGPGMMGRERFPLLGARIILTSPGGRVVFDSMRELQGSIHPSEHISNGVPVTDGNSVAGYVFVGSMVEPALHPVDKAFLSAVNRAVLFTAIGIVIVTVIIGSLLVLHITSPVKRLSTAASKVGSGDFGVRVEIERKDEIGNLTRQFNSMAESLQRAENSRKQIISDSAHELRTPVSLIQGKLEMILDGIYRPDREHLQDIFEETLTLSRLISELQELADADAGALSLLKEKIDLGDIIDRGVLMYGPKIEAAGISLQVNRSAKDQGTDELVLYGNGQKIYQVLTNLLSNALRHTPKSGMIRVTGDRVAAGDKSGVTGVRLSVFNSGPPIPEDKLEAVFDRFYRLDSARNRQHGGKGLGLAISKAIIEAHGGRIWAENVPGGGVRFTAELPSG